MAKKDIKKRIEEYDRKQEGKAVVKEVLKEMKNGANKKKLENFYFYYFCEGVEE